jgi:biotin transport system substrate-specific component
VTGTIVLPQQRTLADLLPRSVVRDAVLISGFALLTAGAAQISIHVGTTPVPITGQTFAVLLGGATLGSWRGGASQLLYLVLGLFLPFYAGGDRGWDVVSGSTGGYLIGFVIAAVLIGWLAELGHDRKFSTAVPAFLAGTVLIWVIGSLWLAESLNIPFTADVGEPSAINYGVAPFLVGDIGKALLAGVLLPAAWKVRTLVEGDDSES